LTMRDIVSAPIFLRLGARMRGPSGAAVGQLRRVLIQNVVASNVSGKQCSILTGIPGHRIEDIQMGDIFIQHRGGGTRQQAEIRLPEAAGKYPEPNMFGITPAQGFYLRHVQGIDMSHIEIESLRPDDRPSFLLDDVRDADFLRIEAPRETGVPVFSLRNVEDFSSALVRGVADKNMKQVSQRDF